MTDEDRIKIRGLDLAIATFAYEAEKALPLLHRLRDEHQALAQRDEEFPTAGAARSAIESDVFGALDEARGYLKDLLAGELLQGCA